MKTLHYNILYFVRKYLLKLNNVSRYPASDSLKLHQFVSFDVWVMFLFVFKALFTEFYNCACAKKVVMLIRIRHTCVALIHNKTVLSLETSLEINFEEFLAIRRAISLKETFVLFC